MRPSMVELRRRLKHEDYERKMEQDHGFVADLDEEQRLARVTRLEQLTWSGTLSANELWEIENTMRFTE